jgi:hypothetical protein
VNLSAVNKPFRVAYLERVPHPSFLETATADPALEVVRLSLDNGEEAALAELAPRPSEVARIDVETYAFASVMSDPAPTNYFASKYSLPHAAAALVLAQAAA